MTKVQPATGPDVGGTVLTITGTLFVNSTNLKCRIGYKIVPATYVNPTTIKCTSPSGYGQNHVDVTIDGIGWTSSQVTFTYYDTCLNNCSFKGYCSVGVCYCMFTYNGTDCSQSK